MNDEGSFTGALHAGDPSRLLEGRVTVLVASGANENDL